MSRLFYLQLYSSVLNSETSQATEKQQSKAQKLLSSVTNTLKRKTSKPENSENDLTNHQDIHRTISRDFEQDNEESLHETVIVETRSPNSLDNDLSITSPTMDRLDPTIPVPVLNTRMKNLSQFSFRYRENEAPTLQKLEPRRPPKNQCGAKMCLHSTILSLFLVLSILVFALVLSVPLSLHTFYDVVYLPDTRPDMRPDLAFCLPMPFDGQKLRNSGITSELASFLLYTLSPYYPNQDVLDKPEMLTDLTRQYRNLVSRVRRRLRNNTEGLSSILYSVAPTCSDLISGCQTGSGAIIRGEECCKLIFKDKLIFSPDGLCLGN